MFILCSVAKEKVMSSDEKALDESGAVQSRHPEPPRTQHAVSLYMLCVSSQCLSLPENITYLFVYLFSVPQKYSSHSQNFTCLVPAAQKVPCSKWVLSKYLLNEQWTMSSAPVFEPMQKVLCMLLLMPISDRN